MKTIKLLCGSSPLQRTYCTSLETCSHVISEITTHILHSTALDKSECESNFLSPRKKKTTNQILTQAHPPHISGKKVARSYETCWLIQVQNARAVLSLSCTIINPIVGYNVPPSNLNFRTSEDLFDQVVKAKTHHHYYLISDASPSHQRGQCDICSVIMEKSLLITASGFQHLFISHSTLLLSLE